MIVNERITTYINSLEPEKESHFYEMEQYASDHYVPIIKKETGSLLQALVASKQPQRILEVGTAIGYSALLMASVMPDHCSLTTIEKYEKRIPKARENFKRAGKDKVITLLEGDADQILPSLTGKYDFIFMDAAKGQYIHWLPVLCSLMPKGGMLISDNVLQDGEIVESRYAVVRRNRTIHSRMREYLYTLKHMEAFQTSIVPIGDGITISVKINGE